jgi:hypothetical protein
MGCCVSQRSKKQEVNKKSTKHIISEADFLVGAQALGPVATDVALSAFRKFEKNNNHYLNLSEAYAAYGLIQRLYDY